MATTSKVELIISAKDEFSQTTNKFAGSLTGAVVAGNLLTNVILKGTEAIAGFVDGMADFAKQGISTAAQLETNRQGFLSILGSAEKADEAIAMIKRDAASTPFEIPGLIAANQGLTAITKDAGRSERFVLNIGKALAYMGKGQPELDRIALNLQQIGATGRATMIDIKQFGIAGIPIFEMLQKETGLTGDAFDKFISDGNVSFEQLEELFNKAGEGSGKFANAFRDQAGTFNQLLSNMKDNVNIFASDFVKSIGLFDVAKGAISIFNEFMSAFSTAFLAQGDGLAVAFENLSGSVKHFFSQAAGGKSLADIAGEIALRFSQAFIAVQYFTTGFVEGLTEKLPDIKIQWQDLIKQVERLAGLLGISLPDSSEESQTKLIDTSTEVGKLAGKATGGGIAGLVNIVEEFMKSISKEDIKNFKETLANTKTVVKGLAEFMTTLDEKTEGAVDTFRDLKKTLSDISNIMRNWSPSGFIGKNIGQLINWIGANNSKFTAKSTLPGMGGGAHGGVAVPRFDAGGIVPGVQTTGDNMLARLNSGEAVMPKDKFNKLVAMIDSGGIGGSVNFNVNIPLFMGDAGSKRAVAEEIFKEIERISIAKGVSLNKLSLLGT